MPSTPSKFDIPDIHWADHAAEELIRAHPKKVPIICASGISPSGVIHIGNFREAITVDFVVRALRSRGREVKHIHSWDDYDALRKIPPNLPAGDSFSAHLRKPLSAVPDPFGDCPSYAAHFERLFEQEVKLLGIFPEFTSQSLAYKSGRYNDGIRLALKCAVQIRKILELNRTEEMPESWTCVSIFCSGCNKDTTEILSFKDPIFEYHCSMCKKNFALNFDSETGVKLLWRIDWPMRWANEEVDFEPGGKDHSSQGGSYQTGKSIIEQVWKKPAPQYLQYDFVLVKGGGAKLSSSAGQLITVSQALDIYEPQIIRWIFASRKPNIDFSIAFDLDVIKTYDDFDRTERIAWGAEAVDERRYLYEKRIYELSSVDPTSGVGTSERGAQFPFRHLCNILQIFEGQLDKTEQYFANSIRTLSDQKRFYARASRAWNWIVGFAPPEFRFTVRSDTPPKTKFPTPIADFANFLSETQINKEEEMASAIYSIMSRHKLDAKSFFPEVYEILIGRPSGPKLAAFLLALGTKRTAAILLKSL